MPYQGRTAMRKIITSVVLASVSLVAFPTYATEITPEAVTRLLNRVDLYASRQNATRIGDYMSSDVSIILNVEHLDSAGSNKALTLSKQQYVSLIERAWGRVDGYQIQRSDLTIDVQGDRVRTRSLVTELVSRSDQDITVRSTEDIQLAVIDGELLITKVVTQTTM